VLIGVITDGDLRRGVERRGDLRGFSAGEISTGGARTVQPGALAERALALMEEHSITSLFIVDGAGRPCGILHLHDLLRAGVV
jgi:arabinose-5-phosphate isomerase